MPRVLIGAATLRNDHGPYRGILKDAGFELVYPAVPRQMTESELIAELAGIDAVLAGSEPYTRQVFSSFPQLRIVARNGVGYDAVDLEAATDHGVPVTIAPANQDAVAEHAFVLMLALAKRLIPQHQAIRAGQWPRQTTLALRGQTLGIAGLGRIGKAVALRAQIFGMKLLAYEPFPDHAFVQHHAIELVPLSRLFAESDYVSLHLPLTPDSRNLIDRNYLHHMKPTAFLINTARGGVVNEADLVQILREKKIAGAGLDVFEHEPPVNSPLLALENVVLTAHTAGVDSRSTEEMAKLAAQTIVMLSRSEWPQGLVVNDCVREQFRWTGK